MTFFFTTPGSGSKCSGGGQRFGSGQGGSRGATKGRRSGAGPPAMLWDFSHGIFCIAGFPTDKVNIGEYRCKIRKIGKVSCFSLLWVSV